MPNVKLGRLDFQQESLNNFSNTSEKAYEKEVKKEQRKIENAQKDIAQADMKSWSYNVQKFDPMTGLPINNNRFFIIIGLTAYFLFK
jgi:uncharacterized membrane protein (DUF106 family)